MAASRRNNKSSGSNAGAVFWLAAIVVVLFLFVLNWGKIQETLARTNFHEIVKTQTGADKAPGAVPEAPKAAPGETPAPQGDKGTQSKDGGKEIPPPPQPPAAGAGAKGDAADASEPELPGKTVPEKPIASRPKQAEPPEPAAGAKSGTPASVQAPSRLRAATLYFVRIDEDGTMVRQEAKRQIPASDSPLLDAMAALLKGPNEAELRRSLISLVPEGSKLLSAQVRGSTAYLNFNEAFMYNHYGIEGYAGQLKQVVYTATAFPTVQDVQILIEGTKRDYLGGEGVYIGKPLSRNSF